jgi:hypothetical protein
MGSPMTAGVMTRPAVPTAGAVTVELNSIRPSMLLMGANSNNGPVRPVIAPEVAAFSSA